MLGFEEGLEGSKSGKKMIFGFVFNQIKIIGLFLCIEVYIEVFECLLKCISEKLEQLEVFSNRIVKLWCFYFIVLCSIKNSVKVFVIYIEGKKLSVDFVFVKYVFLFLCRD